MQQSYRAISTVRRRTRLATAILLAGMALGGAAGAADSGRDYHLGGGPLGELLSRFAAQAGVVLSFDANRTAGKRSVGLDGHFAVEQGFAALLAGSGLKASEVSPGHYALVTDDVYTLGSTTVTGSNLVPVTEDKDSYTTPLLTIGKGHLAQKDIPQSVSVVTRKRMDDQNMLTVTDALRETTGITAVDYGDGTAYFQSRGFPAAVMYDGVPSDSGLQYQQQFDLAMYERIEVIRGPSGLLQGSGEPGGSVDLLRKRPQDEFALGGHLRAGTWDNYQGDLDVTGPLDEQKHIRGRLVLSTQDRDYFYDKGHSSLGMAYGIVDIDLDPDTLLSLSAGYQKTDIGPFDYGQSVYTNGRFLNASRSQFYGADWNQSNLYMREFHAELTHAFNDTWTSHSTFNYRGLDSSSLYAYYGQGVNPQTNEADFTYQRQSDAYDWYSLDHNFTGAFDAFGRQHQVLFGANYALYKDHSLSAYQDAGLHDVFNPDLPKPDLAYTSGSDSRLSQGGVYGQARLKLLDPLTLVLGSRLSWYGTEQRTLLPTSGSWERSPGVNHKYTPYAGLIYDLTPQLTAYASYASGFTPQTQNSVSGQVLAPRKSKQYEIGLKGSYLDGALNANLAAFVLRDENRAVADPDNAGYYVNAGKIESRGWEAEISGSPLPGWDLYAGYTFLLNRYLDDPSNQGKVYDSEEPKHSLKLWNLYHFQGGALADWRVGGGVRAYSPTSRGAEEQGGYAVYDALLGYKVNSHLDASLALNNAFDRRYFSRVPSSYYGIYGEPRNLMLTLGYNY
ncbi:MAG: Fe(3+)-pyochelin receptor [Pseudomonas citronellolis]|nr:MAG: Fe(3+)-pyochelin receptor [Pseudomonas citronellolis]